MESMNYTSIEQSKKLLELGLSPESADMSYIENPIGEFRPVAYTPKETIVARDARDSDAIIYPCWSVGALLEVMPPYLFEWEKGIDLEIYPALNKSRWQVSYISRDMSPENNDRYTKIMFGDTLIEAAYNMVIWLLENNYIKQ